MTTATRRKPRTPAPPPREQHGPLPTAQARMVASAALRVLHALDDAGEGQSPERRRMALWLTAYVAERPGAYRQPTLGAVWLVLRDREGMFDGDLQAAIEVAEARRALAGFAPMI